MSDESDFEPPLRIRAADGSTIENVEHWGERAQPAGGATQWKPGRSAYELAAAWCEGGRVHVPPDLAALLDSSEETRGFQAGLARPEAKIALDAFRGNTRNADLLVHGTAAGGRTVVTVEAKADERFGRYVADELRRVAQVPRSNLPCRIRALAELLFGAATDVEHLRYQLVHGLAATVLEAQGRAADQAVFAVHEFRTPATDDARRAQNHEDLRSFVSTFGVESITPSRLRRISVAGAPSLPVFVGLAVTR